MNENSDRSLAEGGEQKGVHSLRVSVENDWLHTTFTCTAPEGSPCRMICTEGDCEYWETDGSHIHPLRDAGECGARDAFMNYDWLECHESTGYESLLYEGPIDAFWDGEDFQWRILAAPSRAPEQKCQHLRVIEQARQAKEGETPNNTGGWMWPPVCQDCGEELPFGTPETMPHDFVAPSRAEGLARECNSCGRNHPSSVCPEWNAPKAVPSRAPEEVLDSTHDEGCECRTSRKETAVCICDFSAPSRAPEQKTDDLVAEGTEQK